MRNTPLKTRTFVRFMMLVAVIGMLVATTPLSRAGAPTLAITVVNNSNQAIHRLYLAPANTDNWGPDQLGQSPISPGASRTLNVSWDQSTVKLVGEDQDGCFVTATIEATSGATWTIASNADRDCN
jgi:hypothetical protein